MERWVKLYCKIDMWEWADNPFMVALFVRLLTMANPCDASWHGIAIKKGQLITSIDKLAKKTGLSVRQVRTCLKHLKSTNEVTIKPTHCFSLITICKYESYQADTSKSDKVNDKPNDKQATQQRHSSDTAATTDIEYKNKDIIEDVTEDTDVSSSESKPVSTPQHPIKDLYSVCIDFFNEKTKGVFGTVRLPLSEKRKSMLRGRINEHGEDAFFRVVELAMQSSFLKGQNSRGWAATFDWLIKPTNFEKVLSGNYTDRPSLFQQPQNKNGKVAPMQAFENMMQKFAGQQKPQTTEDIDFETIG